MPRVLTAAHSAINWDDPLAKGLLAHVTYPSGSRPVDLAGVGKVVFTGSFSGASGVGPFGPTLEIPASGAAPYGWGISGICNRPATAIAGSVLWIRRVPSSAESGFGCTNASTNSFGGHFPWSDGNIYWDFGGQSSPNRMTATAPTLTSASVVIMTAGPAGSYIYQDGKVLASTATAVTRTPIDLVFGLTYGNTIVNTGAKSDTLTIVAERQWSPYEVRQLTLDPFRLVEPVRGRRTIIILNSGVSVAPTFSGSGAVTLSPIVGAGSGTNAKPVRTGSGAITLAALVGAGSGTVTAGTRTGSGAVTLNPIIGAGVGTGGLPANGETVSHDVRTGQPDPRWRDRRRATWPPPLKTRGSNYGRY